MNSSISPEGPIRAIVGRFSLEYSHQTMEKVLTEHPFDFCGIISSGKEKRFFSAIPESQQEWFSSSEIRGCHYEGVRWNALEPLDEELIQNMRECEAIFMGTVYRQEWKKIITYTERKRMYLRHLRFWNDYLTRNKINLYLSAWLPHEIPDVVIYYLCKLRGIPILCFDVSTERDTSFTVQEYDASTVQVGKRYEELLQEYAGVQNPEEIPLGEQFAERFKALTQEVGQKPPLQSVKYPLYWDHMRDLVFRKPLNIIQYALGYCTPAGMKRAASAWERNRIVRERNAYYDAHAIEPDPKHRFVYLALHFQPEMSTIPMGGGFGDQVLIAQMLNAYLPDDVLIYVKEHPRESGWLYRSVDFYKEFLEIDKVRLVARHADSFALREQCEAVATVTGSVGFEALFRQKSVFMFGHRFYQYARGVYTIRTKQDCIDAVHAVFEEGKRPTLNESKLFLKAIEDTRVHGLLNPWDHKVTQLSDEQHAAACSAAILKELS